MNKIVCFPANSAPASLENGVLYFELCSHKLEKHPCLGAISSSLFAELRKNGIQPSTEAFDFLLIALSAIAADKSVLRQDSVDGWTRVFDLVIYLCEPEKWELVRQRIEKMFGFISGDHWKLSFRSAMKTSTPEIKNPSEHDHDCICLLSGGTDSLVGAIDLVSKGRNPLFVSQVVRGESNNQRDFAALFGSNNQYQFSCSVNHGGANETSTRARSLAFFAYALLASCSIKTPASGRKEIIVPENGFISLNIPMDNCRLGSLSTKTTHPIYMSQLQSIWNDVGLNVDLVTPYKYKTKGEILKECKNPELLIENIFKTVSCGKYRVHNLQHCGCCVPCLVRRASFFAAGIDDHTNKDYLHRDLKHAGSLDVSAVAFAVMNVETYGIDRFVAGHLDFATETERSPYEDMVNRGITELRNFLRLKGVV